MIQRRIVTVVTLLVLGIASPAVASYDEGQKLYEQGQYAEAAREYEAGILAKPRHAMSHYKLGLTYAKLNRHAEAAGAFKRALTLDPGLADRTKISEMLAKAEAKADSSTRSAAKPGADADGYDKGQALYKTGKYDEALAAYQAGIAAKPKHAMAHYKLGLTYAKLNRHGEAVEAFGQALSLDPKLADRTNIQEALARSQAKAGKAPASQSRPKSATSGVDANAAMIEALGSQPVFVHPTMQKTLPAAKAGELAGKLKAFDPPIKVAVVPESEVQKLAKSREAYAHALYEYLQLPSGAALIVASEKGVAAEGAGLDATEMQAAVKAALPTFAKDYGGGLHEVARQIDTTRQEKADFATGLGFILFCLAGGVIGLVVWRRKRKAKALHDEVEQLMGRFFDEMAKVNDNLRYFAKDPKARDASDLFDEATAVYKDVEARLPSTKTPGELRRMAAAIERATAQMAEAGVMLKALLEGKDPPARSDRGRVRHPLSGSGRVDLGPETGCFFCSKPTTPGDGEIVELQRDGRHTKVLACAECSDQLSHGRSPQVVGTTTGGRFTPWYETPGYRYGHDRGGLSFMDYWLISEMTHDHRSERRRRDDFESRMDRATEGTVRDYGRSDSRSSDTGKAGGASFFGAGAVGGAAAAAASSDLWSSDQS